VKRIDAIIQPHRLSRVVTALHELPKFPGFTIFDAHGQGHGRGAGGAFAYEPKDGLLYHKRLCVTVFCEEGRCKEIASAIAKAAHTGRAGDGVVAISSVDELIRIRDGGASHD
jgi:nitrogen regulatory protein PII